MTARPVAAPLAQIPNALTLGRLALIPVFVALVLASDGGHSWPAAIVFGVAGVTDQVDGYLARRWHVESAFGKLADPLADRLMIDAAVLLLWHAGRLPWIALTLAVSFGLYGFFKKKAAAGAADSLAVETGVIFLPALVTLIVIDARGQLVFGHHSAGNSLLLATTGIVTAVPLLFFAASTRRLPLSVLGLLQYLAPVLQFSVGVGIRHEPLPTAELIGFVLVWIALIVLTVDGLRNQRRPVALADAAESAAV